MSKCQNLITKNVKGQGTMTPQKINNNTIKHLTDSERDEISISELKRVMI
jgi:hypothetical protein